MVSDLHSSTCTLDCAVGKGARLLLEGKKSGFTHCALGVD
jgi:hypothetical protein